MVWVWGFDLCRSGFWVGGWRQRGGFRLWGYVLWWHGGFSCGGVVVVWGRGCGWVTVVVAG